MQSDNGAVGLVPPRSAGPAADPTAVHPVVQRACAALTGAGVRWALLRGAADLARPEGDVDLLVGASDLRRLDGVLATAGLRRLGVRGHGSHRFYFAHVPDDDLVVKLDVVTRLDFGPRQELRSGLATACLGRRRRVDGLWRLAAADEAWLLLLHLLLDKGRFPAGRLEQARHSGAAASADSPVAAFLDRALGSGTAERVLRTVQDGDLRQVEELAASSVQRWAARRPLTTGWTRSRTRLLRRLELPVGRRSPGLVVALVGPDGAGKTTLSENVRRRFPLPSRAVYMGLWRDSPWDAALSRVPGGRLLQRTARILRGSLAVRWHVLRGRLVLLDRFPQDALLPGSVDTSRGGRLNLALSLRLSPRPDLVVLLDAPGEVMFARKGEHTPELLEERRQAYLRLVAGFTRSAVLDATRPAEEVTREALTAIWRVGHDGPAARAGAGTAR